MTIDDILANLEALKVSLTVEQGRLVIHLAGQVPSPELRAALLAREAEIVARLTKRAA